MDELWIPILGIIAVFSAPVFIVWLALRAHHQKRTLLHETINKLIEKDLAKYIIVGTTTNATIYSDELVNVIKSFKEFHLGVSIETVTDLNDYVRYPSKISIFKRRP